MANFWRELYEENTETVLSGAYYDMQRIRECEKVDINNVLSKNVI